MGPTCQINLCLGLSVKTVPTTRSLNNYRLVARVKLLFQQGQYLLLPPTHAMVYKNVLCSVRWRGGTKFLPTTIHTGSSRQPFSSLMDQAHVLLSRGPAILPHWKFYPWTMAHGRSEPTRPPSEEHGAGCELGPRRCPASTPRAIRLCAATRLFVSRLNSPCESYGWRVTRWQIDIFWKQNTAKGMPI